MRQRTDSSMNFERWPFFPALPPRSHGGESFAGFADGLMKDAPADGFLNEFREVALLHALGAQKGAQGMIGLFGPGNGQAGGFRLGHGIPRHISIYSLSNISYYMTFCQNQPGSPGESRPASPKTTDRTQKMRMCIPLPTSTAMRGRARVTHRVLPRSR